MATAEAIRLHDSTAIDYDYELYKGWIVIDSCKPLNDEFTEVEQEWDVDSNATSRRI